MGGEFELDLIERSYFDRYCIPITLCSFNSFNLFQIRKIGCLIVYKEWQQLNMFETNSRKSQSELKSTHKI
jgi:hypothetical protein